MKKIYKEFLLNKQDFRAEELLRFLFVKEILLHIHFIFLFKRMNFNYEQSAFFLENTKNCWSGKKIIY
jgi:hypothetical protein